MAWSSSDRLSMYVLSLEVLSLFFSLKAIIFKARVSTSNLVGFSFSAFNIFSASCNSASYGCSTETVFAIFEDILSPGV